MADEEPDVTSDGLDEYRQEKFYRGVVFKIQQGRRRGLVRTAEGKEIAFEFLHTLLVGDRTRWEDLHEGAEVGYDVGWTSHGLRVTVIKPIH